MARRKKREDLPQVQADAKAPIPASRKPRRYRMVRYEDGSERPVRCVSGVQSYNGQALSDFYGVRPAASLNANVRMVDSVLGELLGMMKWEVSEMAPELLAETWERAAGPVLGKRSQLISLVKGVATVRTLHPVVHREIVRLQSMLLPALKRELGEVPVTSIRVQRG